jgi:hypothetical protein
MKDFSGDFSAVYRQLLDAQNNVTEGIATVKTIGDDMITELYELRNAMIKMAEMLGVDPDLPDLSHQVMDELDKMMEGLYG